MSNRKILFTLFAIPALVVVAVPFIWAVFYFGIYLGYGSFKNRGHQEFAAKGVSQIKPAREMDQLFADYRHYITYGADGVVLFNSEAYFGDRYVLTMQVPVDIQSKSSGTMIGTQKFYLMEVESVFGSPPGQVGAMISRNLNFGATEWQQVFDSRGDFSKIGFNVNAVPVPNFQKYAAAGRPSNK
jgi:hypothetical protein